VAIEMRQQLKMSQQLIMTPQLQQAIKLLQLSRMELVETIQQELQENPVLEEAQESLEPDANKQESPTVPDESEPVQTPADDAEIDWMRYLESKSVSEYHGGFDAEDREEVESPITRPESLQEHLEWQLRMTEAEEEIKELAVEIIGSLNDDGFMLVPLEEMSERLEADPDDMLEALLLIQEFDPIGVGARDLRECLLLQVKASPPDNPLVRPIIEKHLERLVDRNYKAIIADLDTDMDAIGVAIQCIGCLEPKPGRPFGGQAAQYITPDIYIRRIGDEFVVEQNDDGLPRLRISAYYKRILYDQKNATKEEKEYVREKLRSAVWLIRSINQRQRTIYKVTHSIIKFQRQFLEKGIDFLRPLILRDVAEDIGMHESTIARVTKAKYVHTPQGIYELKYFFNSGLERSGGDSVASESVKNRIQAIVKEENAKKPYSDQEIVRILKQRFGIKIARRTVTKYREMLGILSSTKRKSAF
jgi:RNA polymerase sigma-54 factor